ncbi:hypothetical protein Taro_037393 [Colocasia esculenta]|uniref:Uncharacterized protein n=1 Tax=Colocasia esculenta TaxID=4460 RepID=A0A843WPK0_COLES|nr:hypothetical protein [Colocasia esculenta]
MGSLMAGWNCPVVDPETARLERNRSLTKEEIESFWKVHRKSCDGEEQEEQLLSPTSPLRSPRGGGEGEAVVRKKSLFWQSLEKSKTFPAGGEQQPESPVGADKVAKLTGDWWTRSNWAFLNEPPHDEMEDCGHKYTAQYHVAQIATAPAKKQHA